MGSAGRYRPWGRTDDLICCPSNPTQVLRRLADIKLDLSLVVHFLNQVGPARVYRYPLSGQAWFPMPLSLLTHTDHFCIVLLTIGLTRDPPQCLPCRFFAISTPPTLLNSFSSLSAFFDDPTWLLRTLQRLVSVRPSSTFWAQQPTSFRTPSPRMTSPRRGVYEMRMSSLNIATGITPSLARGPQIT